MATHWQYAESFGDTNLKMLENEDLCDVTLVAGNEQKQIKCHKFILASRSPVFYAMFCGTLAESKDAICVPDIESSTLEHLLRYMYSGKVEINADTALSLLYTARKYDIPGLEFQCKSFLIDIIDAENVCTMLDQAILFDDKDLKAKSLDFIIDQSEDVLKSDAFLQMSKSGLQEVLQLETFSVSECGLYISCKRWAAQRCKDAKTEEHDEHIRQELEDELIRLIRFPTMSLEEFTDVVASENVLTDSEKLSVYRSIAKEKNVSKFIYTPRLAAHYASTFDRYTAINPHWQHSGKQDGLSFTVSKDCKLSAVGMLRPSCEGSATGILEILEGTTVIHTQNVTLHHESSISGALLMLDKCLNLHSTNEYSVRQRMSGPPLFYCSSTRSSITQGGVTITLSDIKDGSSDGDTNVSAGQFYGFELLINPTK